MFSAEELRQTKLFSILPESELARLAETAADVHLAPGEWLLREGEPPYFYVLFEGRVKLVKDVLGRQVEIAQYEYKAGDFFGEVPLLLGAPSLASLRAETACRIVRLERQQLQSLIKNSKEAGGLIIQAMNDRLMRVQHYVATMPSARVQILESAADPDWRDLRTFLTSNRIPYECINQSVEPERVPLPLPSNVSCW